MTQEIKGRPADTAAEGRGRVRPPQEPVPGLHVLVALCVGLRMLMRLQEKHVSVHSHGGILTLQNCEESPIESVG